VCLKGTCVAGAGLNEACDAANGPLCALGDGVTAGFDDYYALANKCLNKKCGTGANPLLPGDSCTTSNDLIENAGKTGGCTTLNCTNGKCLGVAKGENCTAFPPCNQGLYCDFTGSGTCVDVQASGADCAFDGQCEPGTRCVGIPNGKCTTVFNVAEGGSCDGAILFAVGDDGITASALCQGGLACIGGKCANPDDGIIGKSCKADGDCTSGQPANSFKCVTDDCTGESFCAPLYVRSNEEIADAYNDYLGCLKTNQCDAVALPWNDGTSSNCAGANCDGEWKTYQDLLPHTIGFCGAAASFAPFALLLAVAALFALFL